MMFAGFACHRRILPLLPRFNGWWHAASKAEGLDNNMDARVAVAAPSCKTSSKGSLVYDTASINILSAIFSALLGAWALREYAPRGNKDAGSPLGRRDRALGTPACESPRMQDINISRVSAP